jgi:hypothetical protein
VLSMNGFLHERFSRLNFAHWAFIFQSYVAFLQI